MNWFIIIIFIISIALFLVTRYYRLKKQLSIEKIEQFENESMLTPSDKLLKYHGIQIKYLDIENAKKLIVKDGEYLQGMNQANLSSRGCSSIDELYSKYKTAFEEITNDEKEIVEKIIKEEMESKLIILIAVTKQKKKSYKLNMKNLPIMMISLIARKLSNLKATNLLI